MRYVLADRNRGVLERFARSRALFGFDYDGTLAPIVPNPAEASMQPSTRRLLTRLAARYACAVISGRALQDVRPRLRGTGVAMVIGNHGIEPWGGSARAARAVRSWRPSLERRLASMSGVVVEDKTYSVAVHFRRSRRRKRVSRAVREVASALGNVRLVRGKQVLNLLPVAMPDKGTALEAARVRLRCEKAVYVGDDETDEDVFALGRRRGRLLTIRVGRSRDSLAAYFIRSQSEIDDLLRTLLHLSRDAGVNRRPLPRARRDRETRRRR